MVSFLLQCLNYLQIIQLTCHQQYVYKNNKLLDILQILNHIIIFNKHRLFLIYLLLKLQKYELFYVIHII